MRVLVSYGLPHYTRGPWSKLRGSNRMLTRPVDSTLVVTLLAIEVEKDADRSPQPMPLPPIRA